MATIPSRARPTQAASRMLRDKNAASARGPRNSMVTAVPSGMRLNAL